MRMFFNLIGIDDDHLITRKTDCSFLFLIQRAVLLGLKEWGYLTEIQLHEAESILLQQYRNDMKEYNRGDQS